MRSREVARGRSANRRHISATQGAEDFVQQAKRLLAGVPFGFGAQQIFLGHHFQNRPDVLRHAAVNEDEAVL